MKINQVGNVPAQVNKFEKVKEFEPIKNQRPLEKETLDTKRMDEPDKEIHEVMNEEMLRKSVAQANKSLELYHRRIDRSVHEVTKTVMYTVRDTVTDEVIQEFPPRKIQDMIAKMWELAGLFVDEKA
ncbi:flagellar protein FlaG [Fusibacter sp. JL298sf-3]